MKRAIVLVAAVVLAMAPSTHAAAPTIDATASPSDPLFGDSFTYSVVVTVDAADADSATIVADVAPFTRVAPTAVKRSVARGVARITTVETIACLSAACLPGSQGVGRGHALPRARVTTGSAGAAAPRVEVRVGSRVTDAAVKASKPAYRHPASLPPPTVRVPPPWAEAVLALLGLSLLAVGLVTLAAPFRRAVRPRTHRPGDSDPLERAARLLRESATRDSTDRRRAASLAARVVGEPDLAVDAAAVAWSRREPRPPDAASLADRVGRTSHGAR